MRELHVVAVSEDGRHVVLASRKGAAGRAEFRVAMDDRLKSAIRGDLPRLGEHTAPQSNVTPKDIQARLRAGETVEQIAASAGVPAARVERFAGPVFSERERVVAAARAAVLTRPRRGLSALPLGDAVAEHLQEMAGFRPDSTTWSARREESGRWLVQVHFVARAKPRTAGWRYDPATKEVVAIDAWSAAVAHVDAPPARRDAADSARARREPAPPTATPGRSIAAAAPVDDGAAWPIPRRGAAARRPAVPVSTPKGAVGPTRAATQKPAAAATPAARAPRKTAAVPVSKAAAAPPAVLPPRAAAAQAAGRASSRPARTARAETAVAPPAVTTVRKRSAPVAVRGARSTSAAAASSLPARSAAAAPGAETAATRKKAAASTAATTTAAPSTAAPSTAAGSTNARTTAARTQAAAQEPAAMRAPAHKAPAQKAPAQKPAAHAAATEMPAPGAPDGVRPVSAAASGSPPAGPVELSPPPGPPTLRVVPSPEPEAGVQEDSAGPDTTGVEPPVESPPRPAARRTAGGRATVPVWADVLMGTRSSSGAAPERRDD